MNTLLMIIGAIILLIVLQIVLYAIFVIVFSNYAQRLNDILEQKQRERANK